jgi:zinc D-Ala-D-Ala carboxypeptidase
MNVHLAALGIPDTLVMARGLQSYAETVTLEVAEVGKEGRQHLLIPPAAAAWQALKSAALQAGVELLIVSAFRSVERQAEIIRAKLEKGLSIEDILTVSAPPGFSEHHTGRAVDIATPGSPPLEVAFEQTVAFAWLCQHAAAYGFILSYSQDNACGYQYEPWHWCFMGDDHFEVKPIIT